MDRFSLQRVDFSILIPTILLVFISLTTLFSIDTALFRQQLIPLGLAFIFYFIFLNIDYRYFGYYAKFLYALIIFGFLVVLTFGTEINGSKSWLVIGNIHIQPEEFIKPFFIIVISYFLARTSLSNLPKYIASIAIVLPIIFLIMRQPDTGTAIVYIATFAGLLLMFGFPLYYYLVSLILAILPTPVIFQFLRPYQKERLQTLFNLASDPSGASYNAIQALISIGSGGFLGKGLGEGTQSVLRFLPERHTDFIFASISENMGFIGGMSVILLSIIILYRIFRISVQIEDKYPYLVVIGVFFLFLVQIIINIGMNMGMLPIIGITLPFVSYGGSSLITSFIMLGIVSSIGYEHKKRETLEIG